MKKNVQSNASISTLMQTKVTLQQQWQWVLGIGIVLMLLGMINLMVAMFVTFISITIFDVFLVLQGAMQIYYAILLWRHAQSKFFLQLSMGTLYMLLGIFFTLKPALPWQVSPAVILALFYLVMGFYRGTLAILFKAPKWEWMLFSAIITFILGVLIVWQGLNPSLRVIGTCIGIDIILVGWAFVISALASRVK